MYNSEQFESIKDLYFKWKKLNIKIEELSFKFEEKIRKMNSPEIVSEGIVAYSLGLTRSNGEGRSSDLIDSFGNGYQVKSTIKPRELKTPNSFSPKSEIHDKYLFVYIDVVNDVFEIYDFDYVNDVLQRKMNADETFADQQKSGKRPRFAIWDIIIEQNKKPIKIVKLK